MTRDKVHYFESSAQWRRWLTRNHAAAREVHVGMFKGRSGKRVRGMTWPESVAEALCFGWIDGVRNAVDDDRYTIRFTPRKKGSTWSAVNIKMIKELEDAGMMTQAGRAAFAARTDGNSKRYSYEQKDIGLDEMRLKTFKQHKSAWKFFESQAPSYQKKALWWVVSAKRDEVKDRRFERLLKASADRKRLE